MSQRVDLTQFFTRRQSDIRYLKAPVPANPPTSLTQNASAIVQGTTDFFAYIDVHLTDPTLPTGVNAPQYVQAYLFTYSYVSAGVTVVKSVYLPWLSGGIYRVQPVPPGASVSINAETVDFTGQKSVNSSTLSATAASDSTAPAAPTITGSAVNSGGQITITSGLNAESDFDHYELWRGTGPDSGHITWDSTPIIKFFGTSIVDTAIATSTTYWYKVIAKDFSGNSSTSNIAGPLALTTTAASPPSTPNMTGSAATPQPDGSITFTFHPNSDVTLSGYRIWRRVHGTTQWELIHTLTASPSVPDPVSYNDASTILGTQYDYTVTAISTTAGESGFPAAFATGTAAETQVPNAVTNVTITGRVGGVVVKWTPSTSTDVVSYTTNYRLTTAGSFQASDEVVTTNNLQILGLTATRDALANQLQVRVIAVNKAGIQSTSVLTTADFPSLATYRPADNTIPTGPASITITKNDDGSILLSWPASVSVDRSGYQIEIWDSVSVAWSILTTIDNDQSGTITYRVVGLEPFKFRSKQYRFRVRTVDYSGNISSVNLVENPGFETGSLSPNWSNNSGTGFVATIQASSAFEGTDCLKSNNAASINQSVTVTTNVPYTLSAFIAQDSSFPGEIATIRIDWYNSGTFLSSAVSGNITTSSTYQRAVVTSTAPGTATRALLVLVGSTVNPTRTVLHDAVQFEQAAGASGYYDGKTPLVNAIDNQAPQDYSNVSGTNFLNMSVQGMLGQITLHWNNPPSSFSGAFDYIGGVFEIWRQITASNQSTLSVDGSARKIVEVPANSDGAANKFDDLDPIETASVSATYFLKARDRYGNSSATFLNGGVGLSATSITLSQNQDSLVHEGTASGSTPAFSYHQISAQSYVIASGDKLEYDVFVELNTANLYQFALDFEYGASHLAFRSTSILDQNGLSATPVTDISAFAKATWYHRIFDLTSLAGQTINTWASAHEADTSAKYRGRLANIKITNGSTLKSIIYSSGSVGTTTAWTIGGAGDTNYSSVNVYTSDLSVGSVNLDVQVSDGTTFLRQFGYSAEPLIGNPTFEQGGASPTGTDSGWVASIGSTANMTYETSAPLVGSRSLKLTGTIGNNIQMVNRMKFTAKPGDVVFLQGLGSVSVAGVKGFLGVQFSDQTGAGSGAGTIAFTSTTPGTLSLQTTAGANTVSGFIYAKYDSTSTANGSALFDSILASRVRSLDNEVGDGSTFFRTTANQRDGGGRGFFGLDLNGDLSRDIINTRKVFGRARLLADVSDMSRGAFGQNQLENPSFEFVANDAQDSAGAAMWLIETNTTASVFSSAREVAPGEPFSGSADLRMAIAPNQSIPANTTLFVATRCRDSIPVIPGQKYKFGGMYSKQSQGAIPAGLAVDFHFFVRVWYSDSTFDDFVTANDNNRTTATYIDLPGTVTIPNPVGKQVLYAYFYIWADVVNSTGAAISSPNYLMCDTRADNVYFIRQSSLDDEVYDGATYGRPILSRLNAGRPFIDFSETFHISKHLGNMPDDVTSGRFAGIQSGASGDGFQILSNPDFTGGSLTGYSVYDNGSTGLVTLASEADNTAPNSTGFRMKITRAVGSGTNPGSGGFFRAILPDSGAFQINTYHRGSTIIWRVRANIPVGYNIGFANNAFGTGGTFAWITSTAGTGNWFEYVVKQVIGSSGTFSSIGFFYIDNGVNTTAQTWWVAMLSAVCTSLPTGIGIMDVDTNRRALVDFSSGHFNKNIDNVSRWFYICKAKRNLSL
jgi:fibronectin type 3 domain-containing protein